MDLKSKEICRTIQVLLWLWFGTITSFTVVNMANIVKLETDSKAVHEQLKNLDKRILLLKYHSTPK
jgi:hypothetical protein